MSYIYVLIFRSSPHLLTHKRHPYVSFSKSLYTRNTKPLICELETQSIVYIHYKKRLKENSNTVLAKYIPVFVFNKTWTQVKLGP